MDSRSGHLPDDDGATRAAARNRGRKVSQAHAAGMAIPIGADRAFLEDLRVQMIRFANLQLQDPHFAEDAVQEALMGALRSASAFGGRAALRTWVFAILKNKIADLLRQNQRLVVASNLSDADWEDERDVPAWFERRGYWERDARPANWGNPEASFRESQFRLVLEGCLNGLPPRHARAFMMRELVELDTDEICAAIGISVSNLHVLLHRARLRLRECLKHHWHLDGVDASFGRIERQSD